MWGQDILTAGEVPEERIIPTRVGTSHCPISEIMYEKDHPHACGDKECGNKCAGGSEGSSPRVWGQALIVKAREYEVRIIPTRVGTSSIGRRCSGG